MATVENSGLKAFANDLWRGAQLGFSTGLLVTPLVKTKVVVQKLTFDKMEGKPLSFKSFFTELKPSQMYKGSTGYLLVYTICTAVQTSIFAKLQDTPVIAAAAAGLSSSVFGILSENLLVQQKKHDTGLKQVVSIIYQNHGTKGFFRGIQMTAIREAFFSGGYLDGVPRVKKALKERGVEEKKAQLLGGMIAGSLAAFLSQPFDTMQCAMQWDHNKKITLGSIFHSKALAGFIPRCLVVTTAITWMGYANDKLKNRVDD